MYSFAKPSCGQNGITEIRVCGGGCLPGRAKLRWMKTYQPVRQTDRHVWWSLKASIFLIATLLWDCIFPLVTMEQRSPMSCGSRYGGSDRGAADVPQIPCDNILTVESHGMGPPLVISGIGHTCAATRSITWIIPTSHGCWMAVFPIKGWEQHAILMASCG